jgi:hypothetical protein
MLCMQVQLNNCSLNFSGSSSNAQDIPVLPKFRKLLSRERYCKHMFDENEQLFYPTKCNMPSSSNQPRSTVLHREVDLFHVDNLVGCKKKRVIVFVTPCFLPRL